MMDDVIQPHEKIVPLVFIYLIVRTHVFYKFPLKVPPSIH